jgi:hypothetical protein
MHPLEPTPRELRTLRLVLLHGIDRTADVERVSRWAITSRLQTLYQRLGLAPQTGRMSVAILAAIAVGWLRIPDEEWPGLGPRAEPQPRRVYSYARRMHLPRRGPDGRCLDCALPVGRYPSGRGWRHRRR